MPNSSPCTKYMKRAGILGTMFIVCVIVSVLAVNQLCSFPPPFTDSELIQFYEIHADKCSALASLVDSGDRSSSEYQRLKSDISSLEKLLKPYSLDNYADAAAKAREKELVLTSNACGNTLPAIMIPNIYQYKYMPSSSISLATLIAARTFDLECVLKTSPAYVEGEMGERYTADNCKKIIFKISGNTADKRRIADILNKITIGDRLRWEYFDDSDYQYLIDKKHNLIVTPETPGTNNSCLAFNSNVAFLPKIVAVSALVYFGEKRTKKINLTTKQLSRIADMMQAQTPISYNSQFHHFVYDIDSSERYEFAYRNVVDKNSTIAANDKDRKYVLEGTMGGAPVLCEVLQKDTDFSIRTIRSDISAITAATYFPIYVIGSSYDGFHFGYAGGRWDIISIDNVIPSLETIRSGEYPLCYPIYAIIREDQPKDSLEYRLWEWFSSEEGQCVIAQAGLVPATEFAKISDFEYRLERFQP